MDKEVERGQAQLDALGESCTASERMAVIEANIRAQAEPAELVVRRAIADALAVRLPGPLFSEPVIEALQQLRQQDPSEYADLRVRIKALKANGIDILLTELDRLTCVRNEGPEREAAADRLVTLARQHCTLQHDKEGNGIAFVVEPSGARKVFFCHSKGFSDWLRCIYFAQYQRGVPGPAISTAVDTLQAIGIHEGEEVQVFQRIGTWNGGYVVDLGNDDRSVIIIGPGGWHIEPRSPVALTRTRNTRPLPLPVRGGNLDLLWKHANVTVAERPLVLAWLLECLRPDTPCPGLELVGEQGTAKSTTQRALRRLIDPSRTELRGRPKSVEDIFVAGRNNYIVSYENLSCLTAEQQDALCVLATGGSFATRQYYTNLEEVSVELRRPVMLNGISACATRPDLIERTLHIQPPVIPQNMRREETAMDAEWERDYPRILGGLLDLAARTLQMLPSVRLAQHERMADFQRLGEAMMRSMGHPAGTFSELYTEHVRAGIERGLESSPVATALDQFTAGKGPGWNWTDSVGKLFLLLSDLVVTDRGNFPKSPKGLSDQLRRIAPAMRAKGLEIAFAEHTRKGRPVTLRIFSVAGNREQEPSPASQSSLPPHAGDDGDDRDVQDSTYAPDRKIIEEEL